MKKMLVGLVLAGFISAGSLGLAMEAKKVAPAPVPVLAKVVVKAPTPLVVRAPSPPKTAGFPERVEALEKAVASLQASNTALGSRAKVLEQASGYFLGNIQMAVTTNTVVDWESILVSGSGTLVGKDMTGEYQHVGDVNGHFFYVKKGTQAPTDWGQIGYYVMYGTNVYPRMGNSSWCVTDYYHPWGGGMAFIPAYDDTGDHPGTEAYYPSYELPPNYHTGGPLFISPKLAVTVVTTTYFWENSTVVTNSP